MRLLARFDDFSGGEFGLGSPAKSPKSMWTGVNVQAYPDRSIGPRSGIIRLVANAGGTLPTGFHRIGWTKAAASETHGRVFWIGHGGTVKYALCHNLDGTTGEWFSYGSITGGGATHTFGSVNVRPERTYAVGTNQGVFRINHDSNTLTTYTFSGGGTAVPTGRCMALYGQRLYVGGAYWNGTGADYRVHFSNANAYDTWNSLDYFDLPIQSRIVAIITQRDHLVIVQATGNIWIYSGTPGASATLRQITSWSELSDVLGYPESGDVVSCNEWARTNRGEIWWVPRHRAMPMRFDGGQTGGVPLLLGQSLGTGTVGVNCAAALDGPDDIVLSVANFWPWATGPDADGLGVLVRQGGSWSRHALNTLVVATEDYREIQSMCQGPYGSVFFGGADPGGNQAIYWWQPSISAPPLFRTAGLNGPADIACTRDDYPSYGGTSSDGNDLDPCEFWTTEIDASDGGELRPRHLVVKFTAYNTGDTAYTDHFALSIIRGNVYQQPNASGTQAPSDTSTLEWSLAAASVHATVGGSQTYTLKKSFDPGRCSSFQVRVSGIRGVKIDEISVYGDVEPPRVQ